jgi:hypothetical protein
MLTFLRSRSRWIVAPVAGITAATALAVVAVASGSLPGGFITAANAASTHNCRVNPHPIAKTPDSCGSSSATLINRERKQAMGNSAKPAKIPASVWQGPAQSPVGPGERARLQQTRPLRSRLFGG